MYGSGVFWDFSLGRSREGGYRVRVSKGNREAGVMLWLRGYLVLALESIIFDTRFIGIYSLSSEGGAYFQSSIVHHVPRETD